MASKLRPLYDKLYIGVDTWLLAFNENRSGKKRAKTIKACENFEQEYRSIVLPYWKKYGVRPKKYWCRINNQNNKTLDPRYIPTDIWVNKIVPHFNKLLFAQALQDKCMNNILVPTMKHPDTVVKNISGVFYDDNLNLLTEAEAIERCNKAGRFIVKPSVGSGRGSKIQFYNGNELRDADVRNIFKDYGNKNFIIQEKMEQHKVMADIYDQALNTIRIVTFLYRNQVHVLSAIVRIGSGGSEIDNVSKGGYACKVLPDGQLDTLAVNRAGQWVTTHPDGTVFADVKIPNYEHIVNEVKNAASKIGHFRILGWDIGVDVDGEPRFIEYNVIPDQNQITWGPTFGDMTEDVLAEVFGLSIRKEKE